MNVGQQEKQAHQEQVLPSHKQSCTGNLKVRHKGTDKMWSDVNTKSLQSEKYQVMQSKVMGVPVDDLARAETTIRG